MDKTTEIINQIINKIDEEIISTYNNIPISTCSNSTLNEYLKNFYKHYPDMFIEEFLGLKLSWYQKFILRELLKNRM